MLVLILGSLDILTGLSIFTLGFSWGPTMISILSFYLIIKSLSSIKSIASILDLIVAIVFLSAVFGYSTTILNAIGSIWLIQKGIVSFF